VIQEQLWTRRGSKRKACAFWLHGEGKGEKRSTNTRFSFICLLPTDALLPPIKAGSTQGAVELPKYQDSVLPDITWGGLQATQGHRSALC